MKAIGSIFSGGGRKVDFVCMMGQDHYRDALFVFNDNEAQYKAHRERTTNPIGSARAPVGGNAVIRSYQCQPPPRTAGISTGPNYGSPAPSITVAILCERALLELDALVARAPK